MYRNDGNVELNIPPHWHYVTFGLSDLHGDGRVHACDDIEGPEQRSGMGFEVFNLKTLSLYFFELFNFIY